MTSRRLAARGRLEKDARLMKKGGSPNQFGGSELMRQAARLKRKLDEARAKLKDREVTLASSGDRVRVTVTCEGRVRRIEVEPKFVEAEGLEMTLDAIVAGVNAALELADKTAQTEIDQATGGLRVPGVTE
jgi:nucleoid-associated protein EbfC